MSNIIKKIWHHSVGTPIHPILLFLVFSCLGGIGMYLYQEENDKLVNTILSCVGCGLSAAVVQCALIQNRIQKDNIKIQLFDKRYAVFQAVLNTVTFINRDNWDRYILFRGNDSIKQVIDIEENLYNSVQQSKCLFDQNLYKKLCDANNEFCKVAASFRNIIVSNVEILSSQDKRQPFSELYKSLILSQKGLSIGKFDAKLQAECPEIYENLKKFSDDCSSYLSFIEEHDIIKDIEKYITINSLNE